MKITYGKCKECGDIIFSFNRHDYQTCKCGKAMLDGGSEYIRTNEHTTIESCSISNIMGFIRERFQWGKNYTKDNQKLEKTEYAFLKDLSTSHIYGILRYFTEALKTEEGNESRITQNWKQTHLIFIEELLYRDDLLTKETQ